MNTVGRPTNYRPEYVEQAVAICSVMGATNVELAKIFGVAEATMYNWCNEHPEFLEAIKAAKKKHDDHCVKVSLRRRAVGYSHEDVHISNYQGVITQTKIIKHYPPDPTSAIFWLKNRDPANWRDKQELEHSGSMGVINMTVDEYKQARKEMLVDDDC